MIHLSIDAGGPPAAPAAPLKLAILYWKGMENTTENFVNGYKKWKNEFVKTYKINFSSGGRKTGAFPGRRRGCGKWKRFLKNIISSVEVLKLFLFRLLQNIHLCNPEISLTGTSCIVIMKPTMNGRREGSFVPLNG
jgi:hypothetical protein